MFVPLGDAPNFARERPWVNWGLIAANVAVFLAARAAAGSADRYGAWLAAWGFVPASPRLETFFTSMFLHASFLHLAGNMLFLWIFGDNVEGRLGHAGYLLAYLAFGLAAVLVYRSLDADSVIPLVGASGAILGVEGYYFLAFPHNRVRVLIFFGLVWVTWVRSRWMLGAFFLVDLALLLLGQQGSAGAGGGVAYAAHVGGFLAGVVLALAAGRPAYRGEDGPVVREDRRPGAAAALLAAGDGFVRRHRLPEARSAYAALLRDHRSAPEAPTAALRLATILLRYDHRPEDAAGLLRYVERKHPDAAVRDHAREELERIGG
jgi:membrane associated rhomboid family serine protease